MRFAGIDIGSERHVVAIVDQSGAVVLKATPIMEDATGYKRLLELLGSANDCSGRRRPSPGAPASGRRRPVAGTPVND